MKYLYLTNLDPRRVESLIFLKRIAPELERTHGVDGVEPHAVGSSSQAAVEITVDGSRLDAAIEADHRAILASHGVRIDRVLEMPFA
jgi:hypothetical protein